MEVLISAGYPVGCREDFYVGVLKTGWEYRDEYETKEYRFRKEMTQDRAPHPLFVKVSYNFYLTDPLENPIGKFDLNGLVIDMVRRLVVYPGMSRVRQLSDMDVVQGIIDDPCLRCSVVINPQAHSPLLTLFCISGLDGVFVQYGTTSCVRRVSHALESIPSFEDFSEPIFDACAALVDMTSVTDVESFLRNSLFLFTPDIVLSIRCFEKNGTWGIYPERMMVFQGRFWESVIPGSPEETWVDVCLEPRYGNFGEMVFRGDLSEYLNDLVKEWEGYGDKVGRFVPLQIVRIFPEEVDVLGGWETYTVIFDPCYSFQTDVWKNLQPTLNVIRKEHGDVLDGVSFLGTPPSKRFAELVDRRVESLLSDEYGVWYHWKDVAFPIAQFWVSDEEDYSTAITDYCYETGRKPLGILRSESGLYFCRRILSYYLCLPPEHREAFEGMVAELFARKARLANVLHDESLPCTPEIKSLRRKFENCRSLGARKFAVGRFVSDLSWEEAVKLKM